MNPVWRRIGQLLFVVTWVLLSAWALVRAFAEVFA